MAKMGKKSALAIILTVMLVMFVLGLLLFLLPDQQLSLAERRKLEQMPVISAATVFSGHYMSDLEHYFLDQFPFRDSFRAAKAFMRFEIFRQKDNNDIYLYQDNVFKLDYRLQERQVGLTAAKINQVYQQFLQGLPVYYGVIPDKNYFVPPEAGYPRLDYAGLLTMLQQQL
ncbi:MAG: DHHW family protein, partial [Clostridiales bacterium]